MKIVLPESFMTFSPLNRRRENQCREILAEHREPALRLGFRRFVLQHIPVFGELTVFEADDIGGDPGRLPPHAGETAVRDDVIAFGKNELVLVPQRFGRTREPV